MQGWFAKKWKRIAICGVATGVLLLLAPRAQASTMLSLNDQNSHVDLCVADCGGSPTGAFNWTVDNVNYLFQEWFWYRIDTDPPPVLFGPADSLDTIGNLSYVSGVNSASVTYENSLVKATVDYALTGGLTNSSTSTLQELVTLTNKNSTGSVWLNLFQYSDFDMCGTASLDNANITSDGTTAVATQTSACTPIMSQVIANGVSHVEANAFPTTLVNIANGLNLNDNPSVGGVDATTAFQWTGYADSLNFARETNSTSNTVSFAITKEIAPAVPEPLSMVLLGTGLLGVGRMVRRRRQAAV